MLNLHWGSQAKEVKKCKTKIPSSRLQESLKSHSTSTASISSSNINLRRLIREDLKSHLFSKYCQGLKIQTCLNLWQGSGSYTALIASSSFINASDIPDVTFLSTKASATEHLLGREYCCRLGIKDWIPPASTLCKYTWQIIVFMVLTGNSYLGPDLWPENSQKVQSQKNIIRITWNKEKMRWQKVSMNLNCSLRPTGKKARHVYASSLYD